MILKSTRSRSSEDAHRDFDGWDENKELELFRRAIKSKDWNKAAEFAANMDEHLSRGGSLPVAWIDGAAFDSLRTGWQEILRNHMYSREKDIPTRAFFEKAIEGYVDAAPVKDPPRKTTPARKKKTRSKR